MTEPSRYSLRSKLLKATNSRPQFRTISKAEWDDISEPYT